MLMRIVVIYSVVLAVARPCLMVRLLMLMNARALIITHATRPARTYCVTCLDVNVERLSNVMIVTTGHVTIASPAMADLKRDNDFAYVRIATRATMTTVTVIVMKLKVIIRVMMCVLLRLVSYF